MINNYEIVYLLNIFQIIRRINKQIIILENYKIYLQFFNFTQNFPKFSKFVPIKNFTPTIYYIEIKKYFSNKIKSIFSKSKKKIIYAK